MNIRSVLVGLMGLAFVVLSSSQSHALDWRDCKNSNGYWDGGILYDIGSDYRDGKYYRYWTFQVRGDERGNTYYIGFRHGNGDYSDGYVSNRRGKLKIYDNSQYSTWFCETQ